MALIPYKGPRWRFFVIVVVRFGAGGNVIALEGALLDTFNRAIALYSLYFLGSS
tara:strand:+ start:401 stop:562 length:162 start_codon:yes stop_codon:yes gene_type:complete